MDHVAEVDQPGHARRPGRVDQDVCWGNVVMDDLGPQAAELRDDVRAEVRYEIDNRLAQIGVGEIRGVARELSNVPDVPEQAVARGRVKIPTQPLGGLSGHSPGGVERIRTGLGLGQRYALEQGHHMD